MAFVDAEKACYGNADPLEAVRGLARAALSRELVADASARPRVEKRVADALARSRRLLDAC